MKKSFRKGMAALCIPMIFSLCFVSIISASAAYSFLFPVQNGNLAYYYGYTASYGAWHDGIDIHSTGNDTIYAACDGVVEATANSCYHVSCGYQCEHYSTYGNYIRIRNTDGTYAYYGHLLQNSLLVSTGSTVKKGQAIAQMGSSGYSTGKHLHFEVRLSDRSTKVNVNPTSNGGSVNYSYSGYGGAAEIIAPTGTQTISDGEYHIVSALDESYGLNVAYDSTDNRANVQLWNNMYDDNYTSVITVKYLGTGYYTFTFLNSGKLLDVCDAGKESGTNVWQYNSNSSDAQQWVVKPSDDGYFYIISKCNNLYLDVANGVAAGATNIQVCNENNSKAQKWKFVASGYSIGRTLSDGDYHIVSAIDESFGLNIAYDSQETGANVQLWNNMIDENMTSLVNVKYIANGYYALTFINSGKSLDVTDGGTLAGTNAQQCNINNSDAQRWIIKNVGYDCYNIIAKNSGLFLDICNGKIEKANNIQLYIGNGDIAQKWRFLASGSSTGKTIENGDYHVVSSLDNSFGLNVAYDSIENGANVQLWNNMDNNNETSVISVEYIGNGLYSLAFKNSGKSLDVENAGKSDNVLLWPKNENNCQKWIIKSDGKGDYNIISKCGGRYLNINNGSAILAANINVSIANFLDSQSWKFVPKIYTGDANSDGKVNLLDAISAQSAALDLLTLDEQGIANADINGDGKITLIDAIAIQRLVLSL